MCCCYGAGTSGLGPGGDRASPGRVGRVDLLNAKTGFCSWATRIARKDPRLSVKGDEVRAGSFILVVPTRPRRLSTQPRHLNKSGRLLKETDLKEKWRSASACRRIAAGARSGRPIRAAPATSIPQNRKGTVRHPTKGYRRRRPQKRTRTCSTRATRPSSTRASWRALKICSASGAKRSSRATTRGPTR